MPTHSFDYYRVLIEGEEIHVSATSLSHLWDRIKKVHSTDSIQSIAVFKQGKWVNLGK